MELGGNITLIGFKEIDPASLIVLKKIVGNYTKKLTDMASNFQNITISMKTVHEREKSEIYELKVKLSDNGKLFNSEVSDRNLFFGVNKALERVETELKKATV